MTSRAWFLFSIALKVAKGRNYALIQDHCFTKQLWKKKAMEIRPGHPQNRQIHRLEEPGEASTVESWLWHLVERIESMACE